jgi:peptidoglycan/LPS O-acetylase OafA/YrhL
VAAPMIFEFPFDLIVMARTYPPIPPDPALYRVLFFAPLFLVEVTTLALLSLSPMVKLSRASFSFFALMLVVFAAWGLSGFGYPSAPVPFALNVLSKIVAFAVALSLFVPQRAQASTPGAAISPPATVMHAGHRHG